MLLLTHYSKSYEPIHEITEPSKIEYAKRWGMDYLALPTPEPFTCWHRPMIWLEGLFANDGLFFVGADAMITNLCIGPKAIIGPDADIVIALDGNGINTDVMLMLPSEGMLEILRRMIIHGPHEFPNEQDALATFLSRWERLEELNNLLPRLYPDATPCSDELFDAFTREFKDGPLNVRLMRQRQFNAYPNGYYGHSVEEHCWHSGDFILHTPGLDFRHRVKALSEAFPLIVK